MTSEKELDTVEVLKAIQKAKEVKDRMSSSDKKVRSSIVPASIYTFRKSSNHSYFLMYEVLPQSCRSHDVL